MVGSRPRIIITLSLRKDESITALHHTHTSHNSNGIYVYASVYGISRVFGVYVTLFYSHPFYIHVCAYVSIYIYVYTSYSFSFLLFIFTYPPPAVCRVRVYYFIFSPILYIQSQPCPLNIICIYSSRRGAVSRPTYMNFT